MTAYPNHYWWRLVENVGDNWIDVSVNHCDEGSDIPAVGDVMVQLGDVSDTDFQAAIVLSAYGDGAPYLTFYQGINSYSLARETYLRQGMTELRKNADSKSAMKERMAVSLFTIKGIAC